MPLLETIGSVVGIAEGLSNVFGSSGGPSMGQQIAMQYDDWKRKLKDYPRLLRKGSEAAGFHPLYIAGNAPNISAPSVIGGQPRTGSNLGDKIMEIQDRMEIRRRQVEQDSMNKQAFETDQKIKDQELKNLRAQEDYTAQQIRESQNRIAQQNKAPDIPKSHIQYYDVYDGKYKMTPNPDLGWEMPEHVGGYQWYRTIPPELPRANSRSSGNPRIRRRPLYRGR